MQTLLDTSAALPYSASFQCGCSFISFLHPVSNGAAPSSPSFTLFPMPPQVAVNTSIGEVGAFLQHIVASTNMRCLTPPAALDGDCGFLAANLYAK
jgi:coatomer subunit beta